MRKNGESRILVVAIDDDPQGLELIREILADDELEVQATTSAEEGLKFVLQRHPPIVLLDLTMPEMNGIEVLDRIVAADPSTNVILMTGDYSTDSAVMAIRKGAFDYLTKPIQADRLKNRIGQLVEEARWRQKNSLLEEELLQASQFHGMVGRSPQMLEVFAKTLRVAPHFRTALLVGATGTGKELVAKALHQLSPAASGAFVACNCSAIVETLFESELFGHVRGAFTGATQDKKGIFEHANGGTVFLDEIGDMPLAAQAKLLRVLQCHEIQSVGSPVSRKVNVRVIAATNRDLRALIGERRFREDLYYRLSMMEISLPGLSERTDDLPLLERYFLESFSALYQKRLRGLTHRAKTILNRYPWPGNVRELENVLGYACMMANGEIIDIPDLPEHLRGRTDYSRVENEELLPLAELGRRHVLRVLDHVNGKKALAAQILGVGRTTLYRFLARPDGDGQPGLESPLTGTPSGGKKHGFRPVLRRRALSGVA